jgi:hypothetical protein
MSEAMDGEQPMTKQALWVGIFAAAVALGAPVAALTAADQARTPSSGGGGTAALAAAEAQRRAAAQNLLTAHGIPPTQVLGLHPAGRQFQATVNSGNGPSTVVIVNPDTGAVIPASPTVPRPPSGGGGVTRR